ncbi:uncharacterized protein LOC141615360 isoform X2 [Silene latifolia]|uniref:uncharacterized protein LOC141615360 isoform X2 n=1 Tax=Silene latifolia TaxID=37657 RepID=UPI003D77DB40
MSYPLSDFLKENPLVKPRVLRSSRVQEKKRASASGSSDAKDGSRAKYGKGGEGSGGVKCIHFALRFKTCISIFPTLMPQRVIGCNICSSV